MTRKSNWLGYFLAPACLYLSIFLVSAFSNISYVRADVRLPAFFSNYMVVQRQMPIKVWGWADPGEEVTVSFAGHSVTTKSNDDGNWGIVLPAAEANKAPQVMTVTGNNKIEIQDILIGEVWLCSGQSNMEWTVQQCANAKEEIANANHPTIRHIKIPNRVSASPQTDVVADWKVCSPETAATFSATAYYTAVNLHVELDVPIGLINSCWGGTRIEPWTCLSGLQKVDSLNELHQATLKRTPGTKSHQAVLTEHIAATEAWLAKTKTAIESGEPTAPSPAFPKELKPLARNTAATSLYNGMIHPLVGLPIRGAFWYQGESNRKDGMMYYEKKKALINGWREIWGQGDFPFYFVQIAPFQYGQEDPEVLAEFWEAQAATLNIVNTGMAISNDIATLNDIHPPNKQDVGKRLATLALKDVYARDDLVARSPEFDTITLEGSQLRVTFKNTGGGLKTRDGKPPTHFQVVGPGSAGFQPATAVIDGDSVLLTGESLASPVAFRFAWHKLAEPNLVGGSDLPVGAVRGGKVPSFLDQLPDGDDYQLVYELDLARLGPEIAYDKDRHQQISSFDRVGYQIELESDSHGKQSVFVSMKAFTDDPGMIGVPTKTSGASFQQNLEAVEVFADDKLTKVESANIEFWPNNYNPNNAASVKGASNTSYDFGDATYGGRNGYGSMQVHNTAASETIFAINHWSEGDKADIGIGNNPKQNPDWTFAGNASDYKTKRLRVYVRSSEQEANQDK